MNYVKPFSGLNKNDTEIAGGKGASLGEMTRAGILVPDGFVLLSSAFEYFLNETGLVKEIDLILSQARKDDMKSIELASEKVRALILTKPISVAVLESINDSYNKINSTYVAVRSSATEEDGSEHAWAGQLDSFLNTTSDKLITNIQQCWASLFTPRAIFYRFEKGLDKTNISVAVVIQKMVNSEISGIGFSVHPVTADANQLIIEAGYGLGEAIVSGSITPNSYVVSKDPRAVIEKNISTQTRALYRIDSGGNHWQTVLEPEASSQVLSELQILELSDLIVKIEAHYGFPCDIEWAYENGKFFIVQSRPITTLDKSNFPRNEVQKIKEKNLVSNITTDSLDGWQKMAARTQDLLHWDANISVRREKINVGPIYFGSRNDLILKNDVALPIFFGKNKPINERSNLHQYCIEISKDLETAIGKVIDQIESDLDVTPGNSREDALFLYKTFRRNMGYMLFGLSCSKVPVEFIKESLGERFTTVREKILRPHSRTMLGREAQAIFLVQKDAAKQSSDWVNQQAEAMAKKYGFIHSEYVSKSWTAEDYKKVFLGTILEIDNEDEFIETSFSDYERWLVTIIQRLSYMHDEGKTALVRANWALRETFKVLGLDDSLLRLTEQEFFYWAETGGLPSSAELNERKTHFAILSQDTTYSFYFGKKNVEAFAYEQDLLKSQIPKSDLIEGRVAFGGLVQGRVRIVETQEDSKLLEEGEVLVAGMTTPAYIDAMRKAVAFVTDEGGIICHAAIIAREFKKPCVVGTKIATQVLKTGDFVEVDAENGVIKVLSN